MKPAFVIALYLTGLFLTFGYLYNGADCTGRPHPWACQGEREATAVILGVVWPAYWAGRIGIAVTAPNHKDRR